jgi:hypothetical protein
MCDRRAHRRACRRGRVGPTSLIRWDPIRQRGYVSTIAPWTLAVPYTRTRPSPPSCATVLLEWCPWQSDCKLSGSRRSRRRLGAASHGRRPWRSGRRPDASTSDAPRGERPGALAKRRRSLLRRATSGLLPLSRVLRAARSAPHKGLAPRFPARLGRSRRHAHHPRSGARPFPGCGWATGSLPLSESEDTLASLAGEHVFQRALIALVALADRSLAVMD